MSRIHELTWKLSGKWCDFLSRDEVIFLMREIEIYRENVDIALEGLRVYGFLIGGGSAYTNFDKILDVLYDRLLQRVSKKTVLGY